MDTESQTPEQARQAIEEWERLVRVEDDARLARIRRVFRHIQGGEGESGSGNLRPDTGA